MLLFDDLKYVHIRRLGDRYLARIDLMNIVVFE
jgi:hypothetical protein